MGLITQTITFTLGLIPSPSDWTAQFDAVYNLVNGQLDSANVDKTSSDGIMVLDTAQTRTGTLTHNADILIGNTYGLLIGGASQVAGGGVTSELEVLGTAGADSSGLIGRWSADAPGPILYLGKSRNATVGSFTIVQDNDILGEINFLGDDGTDIATPGASIFARVNGTPGANDLPTELVFCTTADGGNSVTERLSILANGTLAPIANDGVALGTTSLGFSDFHLATGGVINWANGEITLTESDANTLTMAGGNLAIGTGTVTLASVLANSDDSGAIGASGTAFSDLFLAVGAVINFGAGDVTETHSTNTLAFAGASSGYTFDSIIFVNDTANASMTTGLTINQGAADNEILSLKSSDVAHGITSITETDTYGFMQKSTGATGALQIFGLGTTTVGLVLDGAHVTDDTTHTAAGAGIVYVRARLKSGTTVGAPGADANLFIVADNSGTRFIVDKEGDLFADGSGVTVYDEYDDVALLEAFDRISAQNGAKGYVESEFGVWTKYNEQTLIDLDILGGPRMGMDESNRGLINYTGLARLHNGAIRQLAQRLTQALDKIEAHTGLKLLEA